MTLILAALLVAAPIHFRVQEASEVVARIEASSPGADWAKEGREAALADVRIDGAVQQNVMLYAGTARHVYSVFLGKMTAGDHTIEIVRNPQYSAKSAELEIYNIELREVKPADPYYAVLANAPVLYARENTIGKFTDVPITVYCERLMAGGKPLLQYTVIFSNEDGGTSTRALMARWGRTTDIEYIYRGFVDPQGRMPVARIQGRNHKEIDFDGKYSGTHPVLAPITDNNMVGANVETAIRYQIAPVEADLSNATRESVMDSNPITWTVMQKELIHEGKLRAFGTVDGQKISDARNYLYMDVRSTLTDARIDFLVKLKGDPKWRSSSLGRPDYMIERNTWARTTIELPPGTKMADIEQLGFACLSNERAISGTCRVEALNFVFMLDANGLPGPKKPVDAHFEIPSGITWTLPLK